MEHGCLKEKDKDESRYVIQLVDSGFLSWVNALFDIINCRWHSKGKKKGKDGL